MRCIPRMASPRTSATSPRRTARSCGGSGRARSTPARFAHSATRVRPTPSSPRPKPRHASERRAARWYRLRGYRVLDTNAWLAGGELDLVARRGVTLVFCEVKSKSGPGFGDPLEMVTEEKMRRIRRVAEAWLARRPELTELTVRFDVIVERGRRLECVRSAF